MADLHPVQSALTNLSIGIFVLESMVYYLAGLCDEDLFLLNDIENSIIQVFKIFLVLNNYFFRDILIKYYAMLLRL